METGKAFPPSLNLYLIVCAECSADWDEVTLEGADVYDEDGGEGGDLLHGGDEASSIVRLTLVVKLEDVRLPCWSQRDTTGSW